MAEIVKIWLADFQDECSSTFPGTCVLGEGRTWNEWLNALIEVKACRDEAEAAVARLRDQQVQIRTSRELLKAILAEIDAIRRKPSVVAGDRESAKEASKDCPYCHGEGMATLWYRVARKVQDRNGDIVHIARTCATHCVCKLGEWMRTKVDKADLDRMPDYRECLEGKSPWMADDPGWFVEECDSEVKPMDWKSLARKLYGVLSVPEDCKVDAPKRRK